MVSLGFVGKPNCGKSTLFSAATLTDVDIQNYPFTTIDFNRGVTWVRQPCVCREFGLQCAPRHGKCVDGTRFIPIEVIDVAGLVPGAHEGKGLGNMFLSHLSLASCLVHVVDASGGTDLEGKVVKPGSHDPLEDVVFLEREIDEWIMGILKKNWDKISRRLKAEKDKSSEIIWDVLSGLGVGLSELENILRDFQILDSDEKLLEFATRVRRENKPIVLAANKIDVPEAADNVKKLMDLDYRVVPVCAEAELALRRASEKGIVEYNPGDSGFEVVGEASEKQLKGLEFLRENVLKRYGSTGVQELVNTSVFDFLRLVAVYPVANENKLTDSKDTVLPDVFLVKEGTRMRDFAAKVHTDFAKNFIGAVDARTKKRLGEDYAVKNRDVVRILSGK